MVVVEEEEEEEVEEEEEPFMGSFIRFCRGSTLALAVASRGTGRMGHWVSQGRGPFRLICSALSPGPGVARSIDDSFTIVCFVCVCVCVCVCLGVYGVYGVCLPLCSVCVCVCVRVKDLTHL